MSLINKAPEDNRYDGITALSTDDEKIEAFLKALFDRSPDYVPYDKLFIENTKRFNGYLESTGFVNRVPTHSHHPLYELSPMGYIEMGRNDNSYTKYRAVKTIEENKEANYNMVINDLKQKLYESQLKINELALRKTPNWRERNWLWIAVFAWAVGIVTDIVKESILRKNPTETVNPKNQIQEKLDTNLKQK